MSNLNLAVIFVTSLLVLACSQGPTENEEFSMDGYYIDSESELIEDSWGGEESSGEAVQDSNQYIEEQLENSDPYSKHSLETEDSKVATAPVVDQYSEYDTAANAPVIERDGQYYTVAKGDTLMFIAFKLYGDYYKWRELGRLNPQAMSGIREGQKLRYSPPSIPFNWAPRGNPHLIVYGETLGTISSKYYLSSDKWRVIWENNREMIKDPNLIFAGFTLYYQPLASLASSR